MKNFIKLMLAVCFAFTLAACGKPDPAADYKKFAEWDKTMQSTTAAYQVELQNQLAAVKESAELEPILKNYQDKIQSVTQDLDKLDIKSPEILSLKEKAKVVLLESSSIMADTATVMASPDAEKEAKAQALQEKVVKLTQATQDFSTLYNELAQKYGEKAAK